MDLLLGRLGLEVARIPHADRHGLVWLSKGTLHVEDGCVRFSTAGFDDFPKGCYAIPHQTVSAIILGPGSSVTHDALRILASHGTCLIAAGDNGVRLYTAPPLRPDQSQIARRQTRVWADDGSRQLIARRMYAWRFGEVFPNKDMDSLRGMEGARMKRLYETLAAQHGLKWSGRSYDRNDPGSTDVLNQALNHVATAMYAAAAIAVYAVGAIPQLGFIHEDSGDAFCLDIADLYRAKETIPLAFSAVKMAEKDQSKTLDRHARHAVGRRLREGGIISDMIGRIKELFDADSTRGNA